jgi:hypothetical protein
MRYHPQTDILIVIIHEHRCLRDQDATGESVLFVRIAEDNTHRPTPVSLGNGTLVLAVSPLHLLPGRFLIAVLVNVRIATFTFVTKTARASGPSICRLVFPITAIFVLGLRFVPVIDCSRLSVCDLLLQLQELPG